MRKIKVMHFPIGNVKGGITRYALNHWEHVDKEKFTFDFATMYKKLDFEDVLKASGANVFYISAYAEENLEIFRKEIKAILSRGYDIVHLHTSFWKSFEVEKIAMEYGVPKIIVHSHNTAADIVGDDDREKAVTNHNQLKEEFDKHLATDFWACSRSAADWLFGPQISRDEIRVLNNAITIEDFTYNPESRESARNRLAIDKKLLIGHIGRFSYQKNHEFIISFFNKIHQLLPETTLMLVGIGPTKDQMVQKIKELGLEKDVIVLEKIDNVNEMMQAMDLFIMPSYFEGLPMVLVEAQASGLMCIVTDRITSEVKIIDKLIQLPLDEDMWVSVAKNKLQQVTRHDTSEEMTAKGYNIQKQVKVLEREYMKDVFIEDESENWGKKNELTSCGL